MLSLKKLVEAEFNTKWTFTPKHFFGTNFDSTGLTKWIQVKFSPLTGIQEGSQNECLGSQGLLEIYTYADNLGSALEMSEIAVDIARGASNFDVATSMTFDQNTFDNNIWYVNTRMTVGRMYDYELQAEFVLLTEDGGAILTEDNGSIITEASWNTPPLT